MTATHPGAAPADPDIDVALTDPDPQPAPPSAAAPRPETRPAPTDQPAPEPETTAAPSRAAHLRAAIGLAKVLARQPISVAEAWRRSGLIHPNRIPERSQLLATLWLISNRFDRVLWFALYAITPAVLAGAVLYVAERPTRRWGTVLAVLIVLFFIPFALA